MSVGDGAAMRIAPLAFHVDPANDLQLIPDVCRITHHNEEAYVGALAIVLAIHSLTFDQSTPADLFQTVLQTTCVRDCLVELNNLADDLTIADVGSHFGSSRYVVNSVPLVIYAACFIERFPFDVRDLAYPAPNDRPASKRARDRTDRRRNRRHTRKDLWPLNQKTLRTCSLTELCGQGKFNSRLLVEDWKARQMLSLDTP